MSLLNQEGNVQYDDDDAENLGLENFGSPIGTGEDEVYDAETSFDVVDLNAPDFYKNRDEAVDSFYKHIGYEAS